jgi:hypothetical protein
MTEHLSNPTPEARRPVTEAELLALGQLCASSEVDASAIAAHQALDASPNTYGNFAIPFTSGEITTEPGMLYRQVGIEAVEDLALSGIVRNGATANGEEHPRWGHRVFWSQGQEGVHTSTGGRAVIVAPESAAAKGWVTSQHVKSIYTKTPEGKVVDIMPKREAK